MSLDENLFAPPGEVIEPIELGIAKARAFAFFLQEIGAQAFARLVEVRRQAESAAEVVIVEVEVERPQHLMHPICRLEVIAAVFAEGDDMQPGVLALRRDFPSVPHVFLTGENEPRRLCLYEQPYENERLNWTPARFLKRIRMWLAKTAAGTLHAEDQPLEPLIAGSPARLILPPDFAVSNFEAKAGLLDIYRISAGEDAELTLVAQWRDENNPPQVHAVAAVFACQPQAHSVMRQQPQNVQALRELCGPAGLDLGAQLAERIRDWHVQKPAPAILKSKLILVLSLPKTRREGSIIETIEQWAFMTLVSVEEVGVALDVIQTSEGVAGYVIGQHEIDADKLSQILLLPLHVLHALSQETAAKSNGAEPVRRKVVAVGMGALGSQIFNNLLRAGYGKWSVIDPDIFLPHNAARHLLGEWAVGHFKVKAIASAASSTFAHGGGITAIPADVLKPGKHAQDIEEAFGQSELVFDFSASIAVSRHLAAAERKARAISAFLTPSGNSLVLLVEDEARRIRVDWLEMLHYRAVLNETTLHDAFHVQGERLRYGNSCRDLSTRLAQDDVGIWAGVASKVIKELAKNAGAALRIYCSAGDGEISMIEPQLTPVLGVPWRDWTIQFDMSLLDRLAAYRSAKLPCETGGILLGSFDTFHRVCSLIDVVPSPADSSEWPTSYIRGCAGLRAIIEQAENRTLGQVGYAGEWHSHPDNCPVSPSSDDETAYSWLIGHMHVEGVPAIMLIIGESNRFCLVADEPISG